MHELHPVTVSNAGTWVNQSHVRANRVNRISCWSVSILKKNVAWDGLSDNFYFLLKIRRTWRILGECALEYSWYNNTEKNDTIGHNFFGKNKKILKSCFFLQILNACSPAYRKSKLISDHCWPTGKCHCELAILCKILRWLYLKHYIRCICSLQSMLRPHYIRLCPTRLLLASEATSILAAHLWALAL